MSAKKWNFYYDEKENQLTVNRIVSIASLWVSIGLLWMSFLSIILEYFPEFISCEIYVYDMESFHQASLIKKEVGLDWLMLLLFLVLVWLPESGFIPNKWKMKKLWCNIMPLIVPVFYMITKWDKVVSGVLSIVSQYLVRFNPYNGTNLSVSGGLKDNGPLAFTLIMMIFWLIVVGISRFLKKRVVLVLFPAIGVFAEFLVGRSPKGNGVILMFVAALLLMVPEKTKALRHAVVLAVAVFSVLITGATFKEDIVKLSSDKNIIDEWIAKIEPPSWEIDKWFTIDFQVNSESLTNNQPHYKGEEVLQIEAVSIPTTRLYLRGFYGTEYENGSWKCNQDAFKKACKEAGYSKEEVAKVLSNMPFITVLDAGLSRRMFYNITYTGTTGNIAFVPYYMDSSDLGKGYSFVGDYLVRKRVSDTKISVLGTELGDVTNAGLYTYYSRTQEGYRTMQWYNEVAQTYAKSSTSLECIKKAANYIKERVEYPTESDLWYSYPGVRYDASTLPAILENWYRMELAEEVRRYLGNNMSYSVLLDDLPKGADPVEYALTVSHEGYCMHYATAAALIMKELGVPTRYASGYIVRPADFYGVHTTVRTAFIPDYNAHAWIEVYMDNMGWVPVEVTAGYNSETDTIPTKVSPYVWENISEANRDLFDEESSSSETESESEETESVLPTETESESITEDTQTEETEDTQESESQPEETESDTDEGSSESKKSNKRKLPKHAIIVVLVILGFLAIVGTVYSLRTTDALFVRSLNRAMDKQQTRRAVTMMNRRVYRQIRWKRTGYLSDDDYLNALKELCKVVEPEDWDRYMDIVKRTHYSKDDITVEEMMHCYWCYKSV